MKNQIFFLSCVVILSGMAACNSNKNPETMEEAKTGIGKASFGIVDGKEVFLYTLTNAKGNQIKITNYGGIMTSWRTLDKNGKRSSILAGFDSLAPYLQQPPYFGALIGRYGNRIAKGKFKIDGIEYTLATNNGVNHLHGGNKGYDKVVWDAAIVNDSTPTLLLSYVSKDGEEGYPGTLKVNVRYTLTSDDELEIEYNAETDKPTIVNLTQHNYYNLSGDVANSIRDHQLMIAADAYTPVDSTLIPTGEIAAVKGTPFDFTTTEKIGARIDQVKGGYDHNWVLNRKGNSLQLAAVLSDSLSGRKLEVYTEEPGLQFYSGNFLDGKFKTSDGKPINLHSALCLETQHFPDSPNEPKFPSTILRPGEKYHTVTKYKVSVE
ncbi:MAG: galactose mutarotase [Chitinophagaceae bacterium]|nr:galactose mutarotase [Chitinophagaceae bacterium]